MWWTLCLLSWIIAVNADNPCNLRETEDGSICVCDSTYCDTVPKIEDLPSGQYQFYSTSKAKLGFYSTSGAFSNSSSSPQFTIKVSDLSTTHQSITGFGGAFTDATGYNIARLPVAAQELLLQSYFGDDGIQYSLGRVPVGGTDFSARAYTYADEKDETLSNFALQPEDIDYKMPYIHQAMQLRGDSSFKLFASAWSAPIWMKTNNAFNGVGTLKDEYWQLWADYYIKFFDAYQQNNISFWGVTTQNEPVNGILGIVVQNIGMNASTMLVLSDDKVIEYADGIALHWYSNKHFGGEILELAYSDKKDLFRISTEACAGFEHISNSSVEAVALGSWDRGEDYSDDILTDLLHNFVGWTDWNMALNETGGPNWIENVVDAPVIVNGTSGEFYKQPMFYTLGHFSKFLVPGSVRLDANLDQDGVTSLAFRRPDGKIAVILRNKSDNDVDVKVDILGSTEVFSIENHSINTLLYSL